MALTPGNSVGGLEASDTALQFVELYPGGKSKRVQASLRLPPGVIEGGVVQDKGKFIVALHMLRKQIKSGSLGAPDVILTIPANNIYIQSFNVPLVSESDLAQAAELNMRMISPIDIDSSYYGWQELDRDSETITSQLELVAAFIDRKIVDDYVQAVEAAGYVIAAVESSTISLVRSLLRNKLLKHEAPYLVVQIQSSGIYFILVKSKNIAFNFFSPWATVRGQDQTISLDSAESLMEVEMRRLFNFYSTHWSGSEVKNIALVTPALESELSAYIGSKFPSAEVEVVDAEAATAAYGAALRGTRSRSKDSDISLYSVTAHEAYLGNQILQYMGYLRSVLVAVFGAILVLFAISDIYLGRVAAYEAQSAGANLKQTEAAQLANLQNSAAQFNDMVAIISQVKASQIKVSWLVSMIDQAALSDGIVLNRVDIESSSKTGVVVGNARNEAAANDFRDKIAAIEQLSQAQIPYSTVTVQPDGSIVFTLTFSIQSFNPPSGTGPASSSATPAPATTTQSKAQNTQQTELSLGQQLNDVSRAIASSSSYKNGPPIILSNINFTSNSAPVTVQVSAIDLDTANLFDSKLADTQSFRNVQVVSGFTVTSDHRISYTLRFNIAF